MQDKLWYLKKAPFFLDSVKIPGAMGIASLVCALFVSMVFGFWLKHSLC